MDDGEYGEWKYRLYITNDQECRTVSITMQSDSAFSGEDIYNVLIDFCFKYEDQTEKILDDSMEVFDRIQ